ncbi:MAG: SET domain-containing protein [Candidatus Niyogibacteria bacterium]|nr:SET domain-containing protein [Candidatus Niyogibacteria bacterium]
MAAHRSQDGTFLKHLGLRSDGSLKRVFATADIPKGAVLVYMQGDIVEYPDRFSIQIDANKHLSSGSHWTIDDELCHSCDANAHIDYSDLSIRAKRDIRAGEEVAINYCASEEIVENPFHCICGSRQCYGFVSGFKNLMPGQKKAIGDDLSPFLKAKYPL